MVCFQETSQTRAAVREIKVLQSCQLYPAKSNSGLRRRVKSALPGVLVIESCRLTMQMKLGLLHSVLKTLLTSLQRPRASAKYQSELESQALIKHDVCDDLLPDKNVKLSKCLCSNPCVHASTCGPAVACDTLSYQSPRLECLSDCFGPVHGV